MPWFIAALLGGLRFAAGSIAAQVLIGLGIAVVSYTGIDLTFGYLKAQALANIGGLPAEVVGLLSYMQVGRCINIVTSAMMMRLGMTAVRNAAGVLAIKRFFKL